jgi:hypothetical protein
MHLRAYSTIAKAAFNVLAVNDRQDKFIINLELTSIKDEQCVGLDRERQVRRHPLPCSIRMQIITDPYLDDLGKSGS